MKLRKAQPTVRSPVVRRAAKTVVPRQDAVLSVSKRGFHRVAYTEWGDPAARRAAICVHGLTRQGRDFDRLAVALVRRGYRVICPDLAGRGLSDWLADPDDYALPQYTMDLTVLLARLNITEVDWVGTSLGGLIGMVFAGQARSPIRKLVLNDIGPSLGWPALYRIGNYLWSAPRNFPSLAAAETYYREILAPFGDLSDADWKHMTRHSVARGPDGSYGVLCDPGIVRAFRPRFHYDLSMWKYWNAIHCPVLALHGEHSDLLLPETVAEMAHKGPRAKVVDIPGCGHAPALLDDGQVGLVVDWLTK
jgi:pimeloyl-ACP methyl ester carboxylesterase